MFVHLSVNLSTSYGKKYTRMRVKSITFALDKVRPFDSGSLRGKQCEYSIVI